MRRFLNATAAAVMPLSLLLAPAAIAGTGGDNSEAAKMCQEGGYADYQRSDGTRFADEGECVSYAARGGTLVPVVTRSVDFTLVRTSSGNCFLELVAGLRPLDEVPVDLHIQQRI